MTFTSSAGNIVFPFIYFQSVGVLTIIIVTLMIMENKEIITIKRIKPIDNKRM